MYIYLGLFASFLGLFISLHIYVSSKKKKPLVCPREHPCERVVGSKYGTMAGIPNTVFGMMYYLAVAILYGVLLVYPAVGTPKFLLAISVITAAGMAFSVYLVAVQAFVIKAWCVWCLGSTLAAILLTIAAAGLLH